MKKKLMILSAGCAIALAGCGAGGEKITQAEYGDQWPFTVSEGQLLCNAPNYVYFKANGQEYAINGAAKQIGAFRPTEEIWRDNPEIPGTKINIGPIISRGLELCP